MKNLTLKATLAMHADDDRDAVIGEFDFDDGEMVFVTKEDWGGLNGAEMDRLSALWQEVQRSFADLSVFAIERGMKVNWE